jgi:hypothetical protein
MYSGIFACVTYGLGPIGCFSLVAIHVYVSVPCICYVLMLSVPSNSLRVHIRRQLFPQCSDAEITCLKRCVNLITYGFQGFLLHVVWRFHQCNYILFILRTLLILPVIYAACHLMHVRQTLVLLESRFAGVIWFLFHVFQLLMIKFVPNETFCCIGKSTTKHHQEPDWTLDLPWFTYGFRKCMCVDSFTELIGPNCVHNWVWSHY